MNPIDNLISSFQEIVDRVPDLIQPVIVAIAGMVPFVEEIAGMIGVLGGVNPVIAFLASALGNFAAVFLVVTLGDRVRSAVMRRHVRHREFVAVGGLHGTGGDAPEVDGRSPAGSDDLPGSAKGKARVRRYLERFGVPGASLLGPLAIPTHFTAAVLVASGASKAWVLLWQAIAIALWTAVTTASAALALMLLMP